jgi:hypothetical protein
VRRNALLTVTSALPVSLIVCQIASYLLTLASELASQLVSEFQGSVLFTHTLAVFSPLELEGSC